mgnify:CR=1 FL=1
MPASPPQPTSRGYWLNLHRWLGLFIGAWFALVGFSGSLLVYEDEIDAFINPRLLTHASVGAHLPPHAILVRIADEFPLAHAERLRPPRHGNPDDVYRVLIKVAPHLRTGSPRAEAMFNPVNGELLGTREAETSGITRPSTACTRICWAFFLMFSIVSSITAFGGSPPLILSWVGCA